MTLRADLKDWQIAAAMFGRTDKRSVHTVKAIRRRESRWHAEHVDDVWSVVACGDDWWLMPTDCLTA